ncbi:hypothetical protein [Streptomyces sp. RFCAC02]|uniref:hypothetical protein n=1 Tax=Streptomyces sp. RFCAC02 TaxID=2499143 RepID=UPI001021DBCD|nr:hypothetical protein [Streptomyces sp. RFCAC02]
MKTDDRSQGEEQGSRLPFGHCSVIVDAETVILIQAEETEDSGQQFGAAFAEGYGWLDPDDAEEVAGSPLAARVWSQDAMAHTDCASSESGTESVELLVSLRHRDDDEDYSEELSRLIVPVAREWFDRMPERFCGR